MITKDMLVIDVLRINPKAREVFARHGMECIGCMGASAETIENAARVHEIDLSSLLTELNES